MWWDKSFTWGRKQDSSSSFGWKGCNNQVHHRAYWEHRDRHMSLLTWEEARSVKGETWVHNEKYIYLQTPTMLDQHTHGKGALKARNCQEIIHFSSFIINPRTWTSATAVTGNVRAVGLPTPACDEWSTMWGKPVCSFQRSQNWPRVLLRCSEWGRDWRILLLTVKERTIQY